MHFLKMKKQQGNAGNSKLIITACLLPILLLTTAFANNRDSLFSAGKAHYDTEDYEAAIHSWQSLLARGETGFSLFYELGNAHYRLNHIGEAVLYYKKAAKLRPWDQNAKFNLHLAKQRVQDRFAEAPAFFPVRMWRLLRDRLQPSVWLWIAVAFCWIACAWQAFKWYRKPASRFKPAKRALTFLLLAIVAASLGLDRNHVIQNENQIVLLASNQEVRKVPDQQSETKFRVNEGIEAGIIDELNGWWQIELPDGRTGWVQPDKWGRV